MKSKSFDLKKKQMLSDKTLDFVGLYKSVTENNKAADKRKFDENTTKETIKAKITPQRELKRNKNKKRIKQEAVDISHINIDGSNLSPNLIRTSPVDDSEASTPNTSGKNQSVKSIMKTKSPAEQSFDDARSNATSSKPKKRNKSVSFMLEDHEEVLVKRTKSDDTHANNKSETIAPTKIVIKGKNKNLKKLKKYQISEKENKAAEVNSLNMEVDSSKSSMLETKPARLNKTKNMLGESPSGDAKVQTQDTKEKKKKFKKVKPKNDQSTEPTDAENNGEVTSETKFKKLKKKKVQASLVGSTEPEGGPAPKSCKKDNKPDIAEDLENLSIGDNAHTLTNLLDEMAVVDKDKHKKLKQKSNKNKKPKGAQPNKEESEKSEEVKEKIKWKKRKWNKDKKGEADEEGLSHTVIVENLPISIMLNYRKLLTELFVKHGLIRKIGIAEVYPTEESNPVFTTTINFYSDTAAEEALQENNAYIQGSPISVKRGLPITQTTLVVRSYGELTDQALSSTFMGAGKIRSIRHLVKGKKSMATAFIEFDGPQAVEKAIKTAGDAKIGGKKIHLSKFEIRPKRVKKPKKEGDNAADADSEDSND